MTRDPLAWIVISLALWAGLWMLAVEMIHRA